MAWTIPDKGEGANDLQSIAFQEYLDVLVAGTSGLDCVLSGCAVTGGSDMTPAVASGIVRSNGVRFVVAGADVTIGTADGTNPRLDLVVVTSAGALAVRAGTAAAAPKPAARTANDVVLAVVYVPASDTTIGTTQITDLRVMRPDLLSVRRAPDVMIRSGNGASGLPDINGLGAVAAVGGLTGSIGFMDFSIYRYCRPRFTASNGGDAGDMQCALVWGIQQGDGGGPFLWRSDVAGRGGFKVDMVFTPHHLGNPGDMNGFFGVRAAVMSASEDLFTAAVNCVGVGFTKVGFGSYGNMHLIHNDASGAPTTVDLGSSFEADGDGFYYHLSIECEPNGSSFGWRLVNMVTGNETGGTLTTNIPPQATRLLACACLNKTDTNLGGFGFELERSDVWIGPFD
jgi:hypothetical protein